MEKKLNLVWNIYNDKIDSVERYCHNCGKKVEFKDSLKRRQNANGKDIFYFAIYKCPKGHTWNKMLQTFKAKPGLENNEEEFVLEECSIHEIEIKKLKEEGITEIKIIINTLQQKLRIDKLLSLKIKDSSRSEIVKYINAGTIRINGCTIKAGANLREKDIITLNISES